MKKMGKYLYDRPALLFLAFATVAFLPVLLPFFYLKNDLVTQMLPNRFFISESLHAGYFPWWNPYLNYGIPQYGDMNCGFWNPVIWVFAIFFRYTIWTISFEEVIYIFLAGWGMFLLLTETGARKTTSILCGFSFMCSGYILGHMQHLCWITGAAFFPFVFLYFLRVNKNPSVKNWITGALFGFLFVASVHPGLIIGAIYFFILSILGILLFKKSLIKQGLHPAVFRNNLLFLLITGILSVCVIASYAEVLPYMTRGEKLSSENTIFNGTSLQSFISLLFPLAVHKSGIFDTDISMRNMYVGFFSLAGLLFFFRYYNRRMSLYILGSLLFFILLSAGGGFKTIANTIIPFASYVRSSGEFSLYSIFIFIAVGGMGVTFAQRNGKAALRGVNSLVAISAGVLLISFLIILFSHQSVLFLPGEGRGSNSREKIKWLLDATSIWDLLVIQSCLNLLTLFAVKKMGGIGHAWRTGPVFALNLVLVSWLCLPYTGVGAKSKKEVNALLTPVPAGIPGQPLLPVNKIAVSDAGFIAFAGLPNVYLKKIGTMAWDPYPIQLNNSFDYFNDGPTVKFISEQPFLFLSMDTILGSTVNSDTAVFDVIENGPGCIRATVKNKSFGFITLLQNNYPGWRVSINGRLAESFTGYKTFITARIPQTDFTIEYKFQPRKIIRLAWLNLVMLLAALILGGFLWSRKSPAKNDPDKIEQLAE